MEVIESKPSFPVTDFDSMNEMKHHKDVQFKQYSEDEIKEIVEYTIELENLINKIKP